jgi:hypothetical protein
MPKKKKPNPYSERERRLVAQEAARIIVNQGVRDYHAAKIKAADRLGFNKRGSLPGNGEIEQAVAEHHQLFGGDSHSEFLCSLREAALAAMETLADFSPRLVGPVLTGTADHNSAANLHLFADSPESVGLQLSELGMSYRIFERRLKFRRNESQAFAGFEFYYEEATIQATVFPVDGIRQAPLSPIDGKPMQRADATAVALLTRPGTSR